MIAGLVSFLSPCVLPLVPPYLVFLAGTSLERFADREPEPRVKRETVSAAALFVLGFSTVFVALGASASVIGSHIRAYSGPLATVAGIVIIIMGLHFLGVTPIALLHRQKRLEVAKPVGLWGAYVIGLAFAFGWTPCIGPILAAILAVAASEQTVTKGASLLAVYSLGLGIPFVIAAFAIEPFAAFLSRFRNYLHRVEQAMAPIANAVSLVLVVLMPSERQATSSSRRASHARPIGSRLNRIVTALVSSASARIT